MENKSKKRTHIILDFKNEELFWLVMKIIGNTNNLSSFKKGIKVYIYENLKILFLIVVFCCYFFFYFHLYPLSKDQLKSYIFNLCVCDIIFTMMTLYIQSNVV